MGARIDDRRSSERWARTEAFGGAVPLDVAAREIAHRPAVAPGFQRRAHQVVTLVVVGALSLTPLVAVAVVLSQAAPDRTPFRLAFGVGLLALVVTLLVWLMARRRRAGWMLVVAGALGVQALAIVVAFDMVRVGQPPGAGAAWLLLVVASAALAILLVASVPDDGHAQRHARSLVVARLAQRGLLDEELGARALDEPIERWAQLR